MKEESIELNRYEKNKASIVVISMTILIFTGFIYPGRGALYPFVKFPMYGYSKTPDEMHKDYVKVFLTYRSGKKAELSDSFDFGLGREAFSKLYIKPALSGDTNISDGIIEFLNRSVSNDEIIRVALFVETVDLSGDKPRKISQNEIVLEK
jgi:hypothetical protein